MKSGTVVTTYRWAELERNVLTVEDLLAFYNECKLQGIAGTTPVKITRMLDDKMTRMHAELTTDDQAQAK